MNSNNNYTRTQFINDIPRAQIIDYHISENLRTQLILPEKSTVVLDIPEYFNNPQLKDEHIIQLVDGLRKDNELVGEFILVQCTEQNDSIYLIDGHHRKQAFHRMTIDEVEKLKIRFILYFVDTIDSDKTYDLFCKINNVKPQSIIKRYHNDARSIIKKLQLQHSGFKNGIVQPRKNCTNVYLPKINENNFLIEIESYLKKRKLYDIDKIVNTFINFNDSLNSRQYHTLFCCQRGKNKNRKYSYETKKEKMRTLNFFMASPIGLNWMNEQEFKY